MEVNVNAQNSIQKKWGHKKWGQVFPCHICHARVPLAFPKIGVRSFRAAFAILTPFAFSGFYPVWRESKKRVSSLCIRLICDRF